MHTLHSREIWLKEAKVVKPGEKPYKIVKARPKYDRVLKITILLHFKSILFRFNIYLTIHGRILF